MKILTLDQIDQLIADNNQKHLDCENFINELMSIDISDGDLTTNISQPTSSVIPTSKVNLSELTDYIFGIGVDNSTVN